MLDTKIILEDVKNGALSSKTIDSIKNEIVNELSQIQRKGIDSLVNYLGTTDFFTAPASTRFHGNYEGGLAAHSLLVYREFDFLCERYSPDFPKDSRKISAMLHDVCKIGIYKRNEIKKGKGTELSAAKPYKFEDEFPLGHGEKSLWIVGRHIDPTEKEALLIRWHMGRYDPNYELNEDNVKAKCSEIVLLQSADIIVSEMYNI